MTSWISSSLWSMSHHLVSLPPNSYASASSSEVLQSLKKLFLHIGLLLSNSWSYPYVSDMLIITVNLHHNYKRLEQRLHLRLLLRLRLRLLSSLYIEAFSSWPYISYFRVPFTVCIVGACSPRRAAPSLQDEKRSESASTESPWLCAVSKDPKHQVFKKQHRGLRN